MFSHMYGTKSGTDKTDNCARVSLSRRKFIATDMFYIFERPVYNTSRERTQLKNIGFFSFAFLSLRPFYHYATARGGTVQ